MERINALTHQVIGAAIRVHEELGPVLLKDGITRIIDTPDREG